MSDSSATTNAISCKHRNGWYHKDYPLVKGVYMALITEDLIEGRIDKVAIAIDRIRAFEPPEGYYVAFSGGKDSVVILDLVKRAGVKFDAHYNITGIDPPELFYFIRDNFPEVERHQPPITIWKLIVKKMMPPTR